MLLPLPDRFEAPRLLVRPVEERDLPALLAVNGDAQTVSFLPYPQWGSLADGQAWLQRMRTLEAGGTARQYVAALRASDEAVGSVLVFRMEAASARAELGYVLARAHWGQGLMREALQAARRAVRVDPAARARVRVAAEASADEATQRALEEAAEGEHAEAETNVPGTRL